MKDVNGKRGVFTIAFWICAKLRQDVNQRPIWIKYSKFI